MPYLLSKLQHETKLYFLIFLIPTPEKDENTNEFERRPGI